MKKRFLMNMNTEDCPCKNCTSRVVGCHSSCIKYINWKQEHEAKLQRQQEQKEFNNLIYSNQVTRNKKVSQEGGIKYGRKSNGSR